MKKRVLYSEGCYALGLVLLAIATALMTLSDFGVSMVVAPAYLIHLKLHETLPFFTFGTAEYTLQAVLIVLLALVMRKFKLSYLFAFLTAVLYGFLLDGALWALSVLPVEYTAVRIACFAGRMVLCSLAVALLFCTYITPEAYEVFVKELSGKMGKDISRVKTVYDCVSCVIAIVLSFCFFGFGHFEGVKWGTIICALVNGTLIGWFSRMLEKQFQIRDAWHIRPWFEK